MEEEMAIFLKVFFATTKLTTTSMKRRGKRSVKQARRQLRISSGNYASDTRARRGSWICFTNAALSERRTAQNRERLSERQGTKGRGRGRESRGQGSWRGEKRK